MTGVGDPEAVTPEVGQTVEFGGRTYWVKHPDVLMAEMLDEGGVLFGVSLFRDCGRLPSMQALAYAYAMPVINDPKRIVFTSTA